MLRRIPAHPGVADLRVGQSDGAGVGQHGGVDLVFGAHHDVRAAQRGACGNAEGARIVPLVRTEIQIEHHGGAGFSGQLRRIQRGAAARLLAEIRAGELEHAALRDRRGENVIDRQRNIGAVVAVEHQRKFIRRFDAEHDRAGMPAGFARAGADVHSFPGQKMRDKIADRVLAERGQERGIQAQPAAADAHVRGGAADVGGEAANIDEPGPDIVAVEVHAGTAHVKRVVGGFEPAGVLGFHPTY